MHTYIHINLEVQLAYLQRPVCATKRYIIKRHIIYQPRGKAGLPESSDGLLVWWLVVVHVERVDGIEGCSHTHTRTRTHDNSFYVHTEHMHGVFFAER